MNQNAWVNAADDRDEQQTEKAHLGELIIVFGLIYRKHLNVSPWLKTPGTSLILPTYHSSSIQYSSVKFRFILNNPFFNY